MTAHEIDSMASLFPESFSEAQIDNKDNKEIDSKYK